MRVPPAPPPNNVLSSAKAQELATAFVVPAGGAGAAVGGAHSVRHKAVAISGPTASGKTAFALALATKIPNAHIINADSRQLFLGLETATAAPTVAERAVCPHHLFGILKPKEQPNGLSAALFANLLEQTAQTVVQQGGVPIFVGGSGLPLRAVMQGFCIPRVAPRPAFRRSMERLTESQLRAQLRRADPSAEGAIPKGATRRLIRTLEVIEATKKPLSTATKQRPPAFQTILFAPWIDPAELRIRIAHRAEIMLQQEKRGGMAKEIRRLMSADISPQSKVWEVHGARRVAQYLRGECSHAQALEEMIRDTCRYAKRQRTWLRGQEQVHWFSP